MRPLHTVILCAGILALPGTALAQQTQRVAGASAAGLCASAMEFVAGARSTAGVATPQELIRLQKIRDTLLELPAFRPGEVEAYAQAWSQRMAKNVSEAGSDAQRRTIATEIATIARDCQRKMIDEVNAAEASGQFQSPAQSLPPAQVIQPAQPLQPLQPLTTVPQ